MRQRDLNRYLTSKTTRKKLYQRNKRHYYEHSNMLHNHHYDEDEDNDNEDETSTAIEEEINQKNNMTIIGGGKNGGRRREQMMSTAINAKFEPLRRKRRRNTCFFTLLPLFFFSSTILINMYVAHKNMYKGLFYQKTKDTKLDYYSESTLQKKKKKNNEKEKNGDGDDDVLTDDTKIDRSLIRGTKEQQRVDTNDNHDHDNIDEFVKGNDNNNNNNNEPIDTTKYQEFVNRFDLKKRTKSKAETLTDELNPSSSIHTKNDETQWHDEKLSQLVGDHHKFNKDDEIDYPKKQSSSRRTSPNSPTSTRLKVWPGVPLKGEILEIQKKYRKIANYDTIRTETHTSASLHCDIYGGPMREGQKKEEELEVVYWEDIPMDAAYQSPFYEEKPLSQPYDDDDVIQPYDSEATKERKANRIATQNKRHTKTKYITFEPDENDGWNNKRMHFETMVVLSHAMGRTLVLPPKSQFYNTPKVSLSYNNQSIHVLFFFFNQKLVQYSYGQNSFRLFFFWKKKRVETQNFPLMIYII